MAVIHGGDVWQGGAPEDYLDFSANLNPDGPPEWVLSAMAEGLKRARYYPDPRGTAARRGIAAHLGLPEDCVLVTSGGIEAAALAARLGGRHVIPQPTFQEYARLCNIYRNISRSELHEHIFIEGECLWLCNPNNPTGDAIPRASNQKPPHRNGEVARSAGGAPRGSAVLADMPCGEIKSNQKPPHRNGEVARSASGAPRAEVLSLLARAEAAGARLVVDEAFIHYCPEHSIADCVVDHPALVVLGSLTKVLAIPGIRLGYLAAHPSVIEKLSKNLAPWRINCVAEAVAAALPGHEDDFERLRTLNARRRAAFAEALTALGAFVHPSDANFLLCDFGRDMRPVVEKLRGQRVLIRPCGMFPALTWGHVRLCVRTDSENARLAEILASSE